MKSAVNLFSGLLILLMSSIIVACSNGDDYVTPPEIRIRLPYDGRACGYGDTIHLQAELSHYKAIQYARVSLISANNVLVLPALNFNVNEYNYLLTASIPLNDPQMDDGTYYVQVRAGDGESESAESVKVQYSALERDLVSVLSVSKLASSEYVVSELPLAGQLSELFRLQGDYSGAAVSSANRQLYTAGRINGNLQAWNLAEKRADWTVQAIVNPPLEYFYHLCSDENEVFVSDRDGYIRGYTAEGLVSFKSQAFPNGKFTRFVRLSNWLIAVFEPFNGVLSELVVFNYPGGTVFRQFQFQGKAVHLDPDDDEGVMIFVNSDAASAVFRFSVTENTMVKLRIFPFPDISMVTGPSEGNCFIASGNELWWYRPATGSTVRYLTFDEIHAVQYDALSGRVFVAAGNNIETYRIPDQVSIATVAVQGETADLLLLYNR
ncbi:hypothetical protein TBC1_11898 [Lentimicrobium saccharophilum]|uniref:Uncharacterized protein n=1 Tax=Lentimicrobium saccharophilum TaxID=1678841 RepID=A0A0S7BWH6_9BACT|nr:hypothetical protein [Lentimicrobium saccharophilum]GAP42759.1 hypothetical protein TBC1_11898 [Lentimicrobium saccharophilum]